MVPMTSANARRLSIEDEIEHKKSTDIRYGEQYWDYTCNRYGTVCWLIWAGQPCCHAPSGA